MHRLFEALRPFICSIVRRAWLVLGLAALLSIAGLLFALQLRIDTDFAKLLPPDYPSVQALERLRATVGGESEAAVAIESPSFEANKAFAERLIPEALALRGEGYSEPYFTRVEYRRDTEFLRDNALYFASSAELDSLEVYLENEIEEANLKANPFFFELDEEEEEEEEADVEAEGDAGDQLLEAYDRIVGQEYPVSADSTVLVLQFYPSGSQTDIGFIEDALPRPRAAGRAAGSDVRPPADGGDAGRAAVPAARRGPRDHRRRPELVRRGRGGGAPRRRPLLLLQGLPGAGRARGSPAASSAPSSSARR